MIILYKITPVEENDKIRLNYTDNDIIKAYLLFHLDGYIIYIDEIYLFEDDMNISFMLIKSLANYAFNHNCFYIFNNKIENYDICNKCGFATLEDGSQKLTIDKIINHSCDGGVWYGCL